MRSIFYRYTCILCHHKLHSDSTLKGAHTSECHTHYKLLMGVFLLHVVSVLIAIPIKQIRKVGDCIACCCKYIYLIDIFNWFLGSFNKGRK